VRLAEVFGGQARIAPVIEKHELHAFSGFVAEHFHLLCMPVFSLAL